MLGTTGCTGRTEGKPCTFELKISPEPFLRTDGSYPRHVHSICFWHTARSQQLEFGGEPMSRPGIPSCKDKLVNRTVIVKASLFTRAFWGTIIAADDTGFCLVSNEMNAHCAKSPAEP